MTEATITQRAEKIRPEKLALVQQLCENLRRAQALFIADFVGLSVAEMSQLRRSLREHESELRVIKNRLFKLALKEAEYEPFDDVLVGTTAVVFAYGDPVAVAKVLEDFRRDNEKLKYKSGLLSGKRLQRAEVRELATLPSPEEVAARVVGCLKAPLYRLVFCLRSPLIRMINVLKSRAQEE